MSESYLKAEPLRVQALTWALRSPHTAGAAIATLAASPGAGVTGLAEVVWFDASAERALAALRALDGQGRIAADAALAALTHPAPSLRRAAARRVGDTAALAERLRLDPAWTVRVAALEALAAAGSAAVVTGITDPHWRVRQAAIEALRGRPALLDGCAGERADAARRWLAAAAAGFAGPPPPPVSDPWEARRAEAPWWDEDPPAAARRMAGISLREHTALLPGWLDAEHATARRLAAEGLSRWGRDEELAAAARRLEEPRYPELLAAVGRLIAGLEQDRAERALAAIGASGPAQALALLLPRVGEGALPLIRRALAHREAPARLAAALALARMAARSGGTLDDPDPRVAAALLLGASLSLAARQAGHPDPRVRAAAARRLTSAPREGGAWREPIDALQADADPRVRAAALSDARAAAVWAARADGGEPYEPSWRVLAAAAERLRRPLSALTPPPRRSPPPLPAPEPEPRPIDGLPGSRRTLGDTGIQVSPLGLSEHYGLGVDELRLGLSSGVNLFFWEPGYTATTRMIRDLPPHIDQDVALLSGSYDAGEAPVLADLERTLKALGRDSIAIFLVFWVRSSGRLDGLGEALDRARERGLIQSFGLSTHQRGLARRAVGDGWPVVMVRHNAAHRGAETEVFPAARDAGCGLISFSSLAHGRMLQRPHPDAPAPPTPLECYRYSLEQPAVTATLCAPRGGAQLREDLAVLDAPVELSAARRVELRRFGDAVRRRNRSWSALIR